MKRICTLVAAILAVKTGFAQYGKTIGPSRPGHANIVSALLANDAATPAAMKTTALTSLRVIAQSKWDNTLGAIADSISLGYSSGNHGSTYDYNTMLYAYNYAYNSSPVFNNNAGLFSKPQVLYDTLTRWTINPNTLAYSYYETAYAGYNANTNLVTYLDLFADSVSYPNTRYYNKFNSAKNIDTGLACTWKGGLVDSAFRQFYAYNSSNKITADSTYEYHLGVWRIASKSYYTYNSSNDLIQIDNYANTTDTSFLLPLNEQYKYVNTYDGSGRLLTVYSTYNNGTSLIPYIKDTFDYKGALAYHSSWKEYQYDPINAYWAPMFYMYKAINTTTNLPDTVNINSFDSLMNKWVPMTMDVISYDTAHNPLTLKDYEYDFTSFPATPNFTTYYYYGRYNNTTAIGAAPATAGNVKVFPDPATSEIYISGLPLAPGAPVVVSMLNVGGQVAQRTRVLCQHEINISVSGLRPGVYWLVACDESGNMIYRSPLVRR